MTAKYKVCPKCSGVMKLQKPNGKSESYVCMICKYTIEKESGLNHEKDVSE